MEVSKNGILLALNLVLCFSINAMDNDQRWNQLKEAQQQQMATVFHQAAQAQTKEQAGQKTVLDDLATLAACDLYIARRQATLNYAAQHPQNPEAKKYHTQSQQPFNLNNK